MLKSPTQRLALIAGLILVLDQWTKFLVKHTLSMDEERVVIRGFFKLVHWHNTGAAWSLFLGNNTLLAGVALVALVALYWNRHQFEVHTWHGQMALGMIFGGIVGNLIDRVLDHHVTDFLYFYIERRGGPDAYFPAFNIADSGICVGVALIFIQSLRIGQRTEPRPATPQAG